MYRNIPQSIYCSRLTYLLVCLGYFHIIIIIYYLHSDALLHHIWKINQKNFPTFQDLVEKLRLTSREICNKQVTTTHVLKFITWKLNININLVKIIPRPPKKTGHKLFCFCYSFKFGIIYSTNIL